MSKKEANPKSVLKKGEIPEVNGRLQITMWEESLLAETGIAVISHDEPWIQVSPPGSNHRSDLFASKEIGEQSERVFSDFRSRLEGILGVQVNRNGPPQASVYVDFRRNYDLDFLCDLEVIGFRTSIIPVEGYNPTVGFGSYKEYRGREIEEVISDLRLAKASAFVPEDGTKSLGQSLTRAKKTEPIGDLLHKIRERTANQEDNEQFGVLMSKLDSAAQKHEILKIGKQIIQHRLDPKTDLKDSNENIPENLDIEQEIAGQALLTTGIYLQFCLEAEGLRSKRKKK